MHTVRSILLWCGVCVGAYCFFIQQAPHVHAPFYNELPNSTPATDTLTIGWVGDIVPSESTSYNATVFNNVQSVLSSPDIMIGNLEGTFASPERLSKCRFMSARCFAFRGDPSFAFDLQRAGFDMVSLVNNHSYDFGEEGLEDTTTALDTAGISYITTKHPTKTLLVKGKRIGFLGLSSTKPLQTISDYDFIRRSVETLKKDHDSVIVIFHGGAEGADKTTVPYRTEYVGDENRGDVAKVAQTAIDAGADIVVGSGPHVLRPIERSAKKIIAYSLGNFVGAQGKLTTTGALGKSGIFIVRIPSYDWTLHSVQLSPQGVPSLVE